MSKESLNPVLVNIIRDAGKIPRFDIQFVVESARKYIKYLEIIGAVRRNCLLRNVNIADVASAAGRDWSDGYIGRGSDRLVDPAGWRVNGIHQFTCVELLDAMSTAQTGDCDCGGQKQRRNNEEGQLRRGEAP